MSPSDGVRHAHSTAEMGNIPGPGFLTQLSVGDILTPAWGPHPPKGSCSLSPGVPAFCRWSSIHTPAHIKKPGFERKQQLPVCVNIHKVFAWEKEKGTERQGSGGCGICIHAWLKQVIKSDKKCYAPHLSLSPSLGPPTLREYPPQVKHSAPTVSHFASFQNVLLCHF